MPTLAHKVTAGQAVIVAAVATVNSAIVAALIAGLFLLANTAINLYFENKRERERRQDYERRTAERRRPQTEPADASSPPD